jgi:hypothetical protein
MEAIEEQCANISVSDFVEDADARKQFEQWREGKKSTKILSLQNFVFSSFQNVCSIFVANLPHQVDSSPSVPIKLRTILPSGLKLCWNQMISLKLIRVPEMRKEPSICERCWQVTMTRSTRLIKIH